MLSPHQANAVSQPKRVTDKRCACPTVTKRITPTKKTGAKLYLNQSFKG
jgi:hypothetical protein